MPEDVCVDQLNPAYALSNINSAPANYRITGTQSVEDDPAPVRGPEILRNLTTGSVAQTTDSLSSDSSDPL